MKGGDARNSLGDAGGSAQTNTQAAPTISLPKGGGAVRGIAEKFSANAVTGTGTLAVPIAVSPGRSGFSPQLALTYDSGRGNGPFGLGWSLSLPSITRRTDRGLPRYEDTDESDIFMLSESEDLVPVLIQDNQGNWQRDVIERNGFVVTKYRPRIEGLFSRIERWTNQISGETYWRSISRDNITSFYGKTPESRIADPNDPNRVFCWLICQTQDDKGNAIMYEYAAEDSANIDLTASNERNRSASIRAVNRYIKSIKYGNTPSALAESDIAKLAWLFEIVFDYGEGHYVAQPPDSQGRVFVSASLSRAQPWPSRQDPFSHYRSCFEVRTYRLCRRVLMFHHFASDLGAPDYLVRATEFSYQENPVLSLLNSVTQSGYVHQEADMYLRGSLPPLEFDYSQATLQQVVSDIDPESLANLPSTVEGLRYRWLDLDGEGVQCVLVAHDGAWYYKRNLSPLSLSIDGSQSEETVRFESLTEENRLPAFSQSQSPQYQFLDIRGDGRLDCVVLESRGSGYYKRTETANWRSFSPLPFAPNVDWSEPNLRFIDIDGNGFSDILITEHDAMTYYRSLAENGFGPPRRVMKATDEERGPAILFADSTHSIFLADMSGDGLTDIVRVRNGEICYWPNLGYGQFGQKISMDQAPYFDTPDLFDPRRIRLADVDGSGVTDIIYLATDGIHFYSNQSGNAWGEPQWITDVPNVDGLASIQALDLLGNGTTCLVWTSALPGDAGRSMRYLDLMGGQKPYLLVGSRNNLGAETRISYTPSTAFYLADRQAGRPWATRLPFPVQVVERVDTYDGVSRNRFVSRYAYHHGYFDGVEREFRGFGMVEQRDTEELGVLTQSGGFPSAVNIDAASYVPPVLTKTWFHTGAYPYGSRVSRIYESEYYIEPGLSDSQIAALILPDSVLPADVTGDEMREALRSLKGAMLRQEVYALDGTEAADRPYSVSERNYTIRRLQPFGGNRHAVFFTHARESIGFNYERKLYQLNGQTLADPRVAHSMTLDVDDYGNELQSAAITYGRRHDDPDTQLNANDRAVQRTIHAMYTQRTYTNAILEPDRYRVPAIADTSSYQLIKAMPDKSMPGVTNRFSFDELANKIAQSADGLHDIPYEDVDALSATQLNPYRRIIECVRTLYRKNDLTGALPLGTQDSMMLPFTGYKLTFTPGLLAVYQRGSEQLLPLPVPVLRDQGGYVLGDDQKAAGLFPTSDAIGLWWTVSGRVFYSAGASDTAAQELAAAQAHFYVGRRHRDPFNNDSIVTFDTPFDLLPISVQDAVQNTVTAANDYRVLQPAMLTDPNGNRSAVAFDALGLVAGTAVMGKTTENLGDSLAGFAPDLTQAQIDQFFAAPSGPECAALLLNATSRIVYDIGRYARSPNTPAPAYAASILREMHVSTLRQAQSSKLQIDFGYSDGFGREIQRKAQAEPGPLIPARPTVDPRWTSSGWTIYNNKGKPVRQYEPFFDDTHDFKFGVIVGVSPTTFYDPAGRVVATLQANHSWGKIVFDPWRQETWDVNDTVLIPDPAADADVGPMLARIPSSDYLPTWYARRGTGGLGPDEQDAAMKTALHANTPTVAHFDSLGQPYLRFAFNRFQSGGSTVESHDRTVLKFDIEGNQRSSTDALGRTSATYDYDMLGTPIRQVSIDAGERWMLNEVTRKPLLAWDSKDHRIRHQYDANRRPTNLWVESSGNSKVLAERIIYGENQPNDLIANLRGKTYQVYDAAGVVTNAQFDFKGNLLRSWRQFLQDYREQVDWSQSPAPALGDEKFAGNATFDALNRAITVTTPDASLISLAYNEAMFIEQVSVNLRGAATATLFVTNIDYNAKGQREFIEYGNGTRTRYSYDADTFRLGNLSTTRTSDSATLQDLAYTHDPVGNITRIADTAQQTVFFNNQVVSPSSDYLYDALYRLIESKGRELIGLVAQPQTTYDDSARMQQPLPTDTKAMRNYTEACKYDAVGNILALTHTAANGNWTRMFAYDEPNSPPANNRLSSSTVGGYKESYAYDAHGNMISMPHLSLMAWNFKDQLKATQQRVASGPVETTYYVYSASGQRVRKITDHANGTKARERIYLGSFELYREFATTGGAATLERDTLRVMDDSRCVALIDVTVVDANAAWQPKTAIRYQLGNHLGSSCLELDRNAAIISYEEYYPYGSTSLQLGRSIAEVGLKRYRYVGKERDRENGFYLCGARYYAPWLSRWISCDPDGTADGLNLYRYTRNNPVRNTDPSGRQTEVPIPGVVGPMSEEAIVKKAADAGWRVSGFKGYNDKGTPIFEHGERMTVRDQELYQVAHIFDFASLPAPAGQSAWEPGKPLPEDAVRVEYEGHSMTSTVSALQEAQFITGGDLKEGVRIYAMTSGEIDPDKDPNAQAVARFAWRTFKSCEDRQKIEDWWKQNGGPMQPVFPALSSGGASFSFEPEHPPPPFDPQWDTPIPFSAGTPFGFRSQTDFEAFSFIARAELMARGVSGSIYMQGSSVTGYGYISRAPFDFMRTSDYDVAVASGSLFARATALGFDLRTAKTRTAPISEIDEILLGMEGFSTTLSSATGRQVNWMVYNNVTAVQRAPSIRLVE